MKLLHLRLNAAPAAFRRQGLRRRLGRRTRWVHLGEKSATIWAVRPPYPSPHRILKKCAGIPSLSRPIDLVLKTSFPLISAGVQRNAGREAGRRVRARARPHFSQLLQLPHPSSSLLSCILWTDHPPFLPQVNPPPTPGLSSLYPRTRGHRARTTTGLRATASSISSKSGTPPGPGRGRSPQGTSCLFSQSGPRSRGGR